MKKTFKKLIAVLLAGAISVSMFACDIVKLNGERVNDQVVATVQVYDGAPKEEITNSQVMSAYSSYGYYYVQKLGYTVKKAVEVILNSLIQNKIYVQNAENYFENLDGYAKTEGKKAWDPERYLTAEEVTEAAYQVKKSVNEAIDNYVPAKETEKKEDYSATARTAPTNASKYAHKLTVTEKSAYTIKTGLDSNGKVTDNERKEAYYKLLKVMDGSGYIDKDFDWANGDITTTEYYKNALKSQLESALVSKYDRYLTYDYYKTVGLDKIEAAYEEMYAAQVDKYASKSAYEEALGSASASKPVVYNPYEGYAYIYNLLLGADTALSGKISEIKTKYTSNEITKAEYFAQREEVLDKITASDLRDTWLTAGYDFDFESKKFLNDYAVAGENSLPYLGTVEWTNKENYTAEKLTDDKGTYFKYKDAKGKEDEDYVPAYKAVSNVYTLDSFLTMMDKYVYGAAQTGEVKIYDGIAMKKVVNTDVDVENYADKINELIFAFSTDTGSLNSYKGYTINGKTDFGSETYVEEYAAAARYLMTLGKSSYVVVGTEYGWHIMFLSEKITANTNYATLTEYLASLGETTNFDQMLKDIRDDKADLYEDSYLYTLQQAVASSNASSYVTKTKTTLYNSVKGNDKKVKTYEKRLNNIYDL